MKPMLRWFLILNLLLSGCIQLPSVTQRTDSAERMAQQAGWIAKNIEAELFTLRTYRPVDLSETDTLTIYLEGDGFAWATPSTPSFNPTPINPVALKLALRDDMPAVYLARPCQYVSQGATKNCIPHYWTGGRFAPEVISATNQVLDELKGQYHATYLRLVGYSGGGAVAALVAARRSDVIRLITIAGNLDHRAWTGEKHLTPLSGSLNPADDWQALSRISQTHFVGGKDENIGISIVNAYKSRFKKGRPPDVIVIQQFDHQCCWEEVWPELIKDL